MRTTAEEKGLNSLVQELAFTAVVGRGGPAPRAGMHPVTLQEKDLLPSV